MLGLLSISEERDEETRRVIRVARLLEHSHFPAVMPLPLFEAVVIHAGRGAWTVSGDGRVTFGSRYSAQRSLD